MNSATTIPADSFFAPIMDAQIILSSLSPDQYCAHAEGPFSSSIGQHMRHILDHYHALMLGYEAAHIDYNQRTRNSTVEVDPSLASEGWAQVQQWLESLKEIDHSKSINVVTEHNQVISTLGRELSFVSSHAVHHFAFIKQLAAMFKIDLPQNVGVAPATIKSQQPSYE